MTIRTTRARTRASAKKQRQQSKAKAQAKQNRGFFAALGMTSKGEAMRGLGWRNRVDREADFFVALLTMIP
jgi:hypothetical protein